VVFLTQRYVDLIGEGLASGLLNANTPEAAMLQASIPDVQLELAAALDARRRASAELKAVTDTTKTTVRHAAGSAAHGTSTNTTNNSRSNTRPPSTRPSRAASPTHDAQVDGHMGIISGAHTPVGKNKVIAAAAKGDEFNHIQQTFAKATDNAFGAATAATAAVPVPIFALRESEQLKQQISHEGKKLEPSPKNAFKRQVESVATDYTPVQVRAVSTPSYSGNGREHLAEGTVMSQQADKGAPRSGRRAAAAAAAAALTTKKPLYFKNLVPIILEKAMRNPEAWGPVLGPVLGARLKFDFSDFVDYSAASGDAAGANKGFNARHAAQMLEEMQQMQMKGVVTFIKASVGKTILQGGPFLKMQARVSCFLFLAAFFLLQRQKSRFWNKNTSTSILRLRYTDPTNPRLYHTHSPSPLQNPFTSFGSPACASSVLPPATSMRKLSRPEIILALVNCG